MASNQEHSAKVKAAKDAVDAIRFDTSVSVDQRMESLEVVLGHADGAHIALGKQSDNEED